MCYRFVVVCEYMHELLIMRRFIYTATPVQTCRLQQLMMAE
jgi:hypothetical protein